MTYKLKLELKTSLASEGAIELASAKQQTPWWFDGDTEICHSCQQSYAYQTGSYCLDCDANVCSLCVRETITVGLLCDGCDDARSGERKTR